MGTPALPIAAIDEIKTHKRISRGEKVKPLLIDTKRTVIRINAAHPFMLMVEHNGKENDATFFETPTFFIEFSSAKGKVAFDDFERNATVRALYIPLNTLRGLMCFIFKRRGRITKPCMTLARSTQRV
jgi:hypothetical protein